MTELTRIYTQLVVKHLEIHFTMSLGSIMQLLNAKEIKQRE